MRFKNRRKYYKQGPIKFSFLGYHLTSITVRLPFRKTLYVWERNKR